MAMARSVLPNPEHQNPSLGGLELPIDESADGASAVCLDPHQKSRSIQRRFIMRERPTVQIVSHTATALVRIDTLQTLRESAGATKGKGLFPPEHRFNRSSQSGPELDLASQRAFRDFGCQFRVADEFIGEYDRLAHKWIVVSRFLAVNGMIGAVD